MASKKVQQAFYEKALEYILSIGAKNRNIGPLISHYKIETIAGTLNITFHEPDKSDVFSIFCQFVDTDMVNKILGKNDRLNPYSSKWNFHYMAANECLEIFKNELTPLLSK